MRLELFLKIVDAVCNFDSCFVQRRDGLGRLGLSSLQKCTPPLRMLAYGVAVDSTDEYCGLGESTAHDGMERFVHVICSCFQEEFLRHPS